jgi:malate synthase
VKDIFEERLNAPNQLHMIHRVKVSPIDLLKAPEGEVTIGGLRSNIETSLRYLESWLRGTGAVEVRGFIEDTATFEVCRAQLWQWVTHGVRASDGEVIMEELFRETMREVLNEARDETGLKDNYQLAAEILDKLVTGDLVEFMPEIAYGYLD